MNMTEQHRSKKFNSNWKNSGKSENVVEFQLDKKFVQNYFLSLFSQEIAGISLRLDLSALHCNRPHQSELSWQRISLSILKKWPQNLR